VRTIVSAKVLGKPAGVRSKKVRGFMQDGVAVDRHTNHQFETIHRSQQLLHWRGNFHSKVRVQNLLAKADVKINGARLWDITVKDERFYSRVLRFGSIGLGDSSHPLPRVGSRLRIQISRHGWQADTHDDFLRIVPVTDSDSLVRI
jgi:hypothetical protein